MIKKQKNKKQYPTHPFFNDIFKTIEVNDLVTNNLQREVTWHRKEIIKILSNSGVGNCSKCKGFQVAALTALCPNCYDLLQKALDDIITLIETSANSRSLLIRDTTYYPGIGEEWPESLVVSNYMSIQWHITNACDMHCKHCYDRSIRTSPTLKQGIHILDDFLSFCNERKVKGHVGFSGGNPFLSPIFYKLYAHAVELDLDVDIMGNPVSKDKLEKLIKIKKPEFYQISLEGLKEHNDSIRGKGSFDRAFEFLKLLKDLNIESRVMLTLTNKNIDQVLLLEKKLRHIVNSFTFCRLSQVGEGASLNMPSKEKYATFVSEYVKAAQESPILSYKDNLINITLDQRDQPLFAGCIGYGCSPAFNALAILPDGEVHACRKFPSLLGNIYRTRLNKIYDSKIAQKYRKGNSACQHCLLKPNCGGCMAIVNCSGLNIFKDKDPYCFLS